MQNSISLSAEREVRIVEKIRREMGATITALLNEPDVIEIMLNPDGRLWVERLGKGMEELGTMAPWQAEALIGTVASTLRGSVNRESPVLECELPVDGSRFEALLPPVVAAPTFTIRRKAKTIFTLADYVRDGIMTFAQCEAIKKAVKKHRNILVVGGTGSGKTTLTNAIIDEISVRYPRERLAIIEDTGELQCSARNAVIMRATAEVDMLKLLKATMRLRPDRILVGEVRGAEALALLKAWNTGHPGGVATIHANTGPGDELAGLIRMEQLIAEATAAPMQSTIGAAVNLIVAISKTEEGRRIRAIQDVEGHDGNRYVTHQIA